MLEIRRKIWKLDVKKRKRKLMGASVARSGKDGESELNA